MSIFLCLVLCLLPGDGDSVCFYVVVGKCYIGMMVAVVVSACTYKLEKLFAINFIVFFEIFKNSFLYDFVLFFN